MKKLFLLLVILCFGCAGWQSNMRVINSNPNPPMAIWQGMEKNGFLLTEINDWVNYHGAKNCRSNAEEKVALLKELGFEAVVIHCDSRSKYEWDHAAVLVKMKKGDIFLDNGKILDVVWKYDEVKKYCYDFILP